MIINTGNRTDIPAYFSEWFFNRIKEGYVNVRNPYHHNQVTKYTLTPEVVDCITFCTKNPSPMLQRLEEIKQFKQFWFVTITPYDTEIEPYVPQKERVIEDFKILSKNVGNLSIAWRYDPIFISSKYALEFHIDCFEKMAKNLTGYTDTCIISFIDLYEKTKRNFKGVNIVGKQERLEIGKAFVSIGKQYGITIKTCAEGEELSAYGVDCSGCMTQPVIERAIGNTLIIPKKKAAREGCDCLLGNDIGMYNTCGHGCIYCYANFDRKTVEYNIMKHNPKSSFLIGDFMEGDVVKEAKQESYLDGQLKLF